MKEYSEEVRLGFVCTIDFTKLIKVRIDWGKVNLFKA